MSVSVPVRIFLAKNYLAVVCLAWDGNAVISGSEDGSVRVWDSVSCLPLHAFTAHESEVVRDLLILPETGFLVTCSFDGNSELCVFGGRKLPQSLSGII